MKIQISISAKKPSGNKAKSNQDAASTSDLSVLQDYIKFPDLYPALVKNPAVLSNITLIKRMLDEEGNSSNGFVDTLFAEPLSDKIINSLATYDNFSVRQKVAERTKSLSVLEKLSKDASTFVRRGVLQNKLISSNMIQVMLEESEKILTVIKKKDPDLISRKATGELEINEALKEAKGIRKTNISQYKKFKD